MVRTKYAFNRFDSGWGVFAAQSNHPGGVNVAMIDGSARYISDQIDWTEGGKMHDLSGTPTSVLKWHKPVMNSPSPTESGVRWEPPQRAENNHCKSA